jgi:hypothetical protein
LTTGDTDACDAGIFWELENFWKKGEKNVDLRWRAGIASRAATEEGGRETGQSIAVLLQRQLTRSAF